MHLLRPASPLPPASAATVPVPSARRDPVRRGQLSTRACILSLALHGSLLAAALLFRAPAPAARAWVEVGSLSGVDGVANDAEWTVVVRGTPEARAELSEGSMPAASSDPVPVPEFDVAALAMAMEVDEPEVEAEPLPLVPAEDGISKHDPDSSAFALASARDWLRENGPAAGGDASPSPGTAHAPTSVADVPAGSESPRSETPLGASRESAAGAAAPNGETGSGADASLGTSPASATGAAAPARPHGSGADAPAHGSPTGSASSGVTSHARRGRCPKPPYPRIAQERGWQGTVELEVVVGEDGRPADVRLFRTSGHGVLDDAAIAAVRRWTFEPARRAGTPVASTCIVPVVFRL